MNAHHDRICTFARRLGVSERVLVEHWAERAAVREYDGEMSRDDAERAAADDIERIYGKESA